MTPAILLLSLNLAVALACLGVAVSILLKLTRAEKARTEVTEEEIETFNQAVKVGKLVQVPEPQPAQQVQSQDEWETTTFQTIKTGPPFEPPMVGEFTLKQWLIHRHRDNNVWARVVDDFYVDAASSHLVRPYFTGRDLADIKRKFLATLLIITDKGVDGRAAANLIARHAHLGITGPAYNATMEALERTLFRYGAPEHAVKAMVPMIEYFGEEMVTK